VSISITAKVRRQPRMLVARLIAASVEVETAPTVNGDIEAADWVPWPMAAPHPIASRRPRVAQRRNDRQRRRLGS